jgi:GNAT superfamily N-acetyltransferase
VPASVSQEALEIREATGDDLAEVLALYADQDMDGAGVLSLAEARDLFERIRRNRDHRLFVARVDGATVGTFALLVMPNLGHGGTAAGVLEDLVVAAPWRGRGIGEALVGAAIDLCRQKGCYKLTLSSDLRRAGAHAFYDRLGFERHGFSFRIEI